MKLFSDGTDLEGVEKTEDIQYMKLLRLSMWIMNAWPQQPNTNQRHRQFVAFVENACFIPGIIYLRNNVGKLSFIELGHTYITVFMNVVAFTRAVLIMTEKYNKITYDYLKVMHLFNHRLQSEYSFKIHIMIHNISHFYTIYILVMMVIGIIFFNLAPLYNNYAKGIFSNTFDISQNLTFEHSVYYALPFDYTTNFWGYLVVAAFNWGISCLCSSYFVVVDLAISLMVFHLWGHMRLLTYNLENFPRPASVEAGVISEDGDDDLKYTEQETKVVFQKLREYIHHHSLIIDFASRMSSTFGEVLLVYYLFHQISGCLLLLECSQLDTKALVRYGPLTFITFQQLIQVSIIFELLGSANDKVIDAVYTLPWEFMDSKLRKIVFLMIKQSQRSMNLKAVNMITVGVQTMTAILKTSFSYFIMLRTVATE